MTPDNDWTIRPYRAGDEACPVALFQRVFDKAMSQQHWRGKFKGLPFAAANVWLATAQALAYLVGHPARLRIAQEAIG